MNAIQEWLVEAKELLRSWDHMDALMERVRLTLEDGSIYLVTDRETGQKYIVTGDSASEAKAYVSLLLGFQPNNNSKRLRGQTIRKKLKKELEKW